jgi:hypothetical protein
MLIRISLIVAIIAGLAVGGLNFVKVKEKIETIEKQREDEKSAKEVAQKDARETHATLTKTTADLTATRKTLADTKTERDQAVAKANAEGKRADKLTSDLAKSQKELGDAQAELQAYKLTELSPAEIVTVKKNYKQLQADLEGAKLENKLLGEKILALNNRLRLYEDPEYVVALPPKLKGKVVVCDPKWNFVIVNVGREQGMLEQGELLVNRNGQLVAKIKVRSVDKDRSVANVVPGWQLGEVIEGDTVIPAHPAS